jgi:hypothetical protein
VSSMMRIDHNPHEMTVSAPRDDENTTVRVFSLRERKNGDELRVLVGLRRGNC